MSERIDAPNRIPNSINNLIVNGNVNMYFVQSEKEVIIIDKPTNSSITNILTNIDKLDISPETKIEAQKMIEEFESEAGKNNPDDSKLKRILTQAGLISKDIGMLLLQHALDKGVSWPTMS